MTWDEAGDLSRSEESAEYENQAQLAADVFYQTFRGAILGLALSRATGGKSYVIGLSAEGAVK